MKVFIWLLAVLTLPRLQAEEFQVRKLSPTQSETLERNVDIAALSSQKQAIQTLQNLIKKHKGRQQELLLELKLGEAFQQAAFLDFRIQKGQKSGSVKSYHLQAVNTLSDVIARAPNLPEIDQAYAIRGKSFEEMGNKAKAKKDYLFLVKNFPENPSASTAYMSLADFAIEDNQHKEALTYLRALEAKPYDPLHPFALFKMGWSHYNLKEIPQALKYLERHSQYYQKRIESAKKPSTTDETLREGSLADMALFFFEAYELKTPGHSISDAYDYLKKQESGPFYGRMAIRFAKLLRIHRHSEDLVKWKNLHLDREYERPETLEILTLVFDDYVNQNNFSKVGETSKDMVALYLKNPKLMQGEALDKTQKIIITTAQKYQTLTLKNKGSSELKPLTQTQAILYESFTQMTSEDDPRVPRVHYNLAETLFEIKDFEGATTHYRWIVDKGQVKDGIPIDDASLKAVASRFEGLKTKDLIAGEIKGKKYEGEDEPSVSQELKEWVQWIDKHWDRFGFKDDGINNYLYEANRSLYAKRASQPVLDRMQKFAEKSPTSKFALPQATLVLDTAILSEQWQKAWELTERWSDISAWKKTEFAKALFKAGSRSYYKMTEDDLKNQKYKDAFTKAKIFLKKYPESEIAPQILLFAGKSAMAIDEVDTSIDQFSDLIEKYPTSPFIAEALFERSKVREQREDYNGASEDWIRFLALDEKTKTGLKYKAEDFLKRALLFAHLSKTLGDRLQEAQKAKLCDNEDHREICEHYLALSAFSNPELAAKAAELYKNDKLEPRTRAIWALIALQNIKKSSFDEIHQLLKYLSSKFEKNEIDVQMALLPQLTQGIQQALIRGREILNKDYAFHSDAAKYIKSIERRVKAMRRHEDIQAALIKISWFHIRAWVLNDTSLMYQDFTDALRAFPLPKNLKPEEEAEFAKAVQDILFPFEEKVQEIRLRAFEIASQKAIEENAFNAVADGYFKDNPSQAKTLGHAFTKGFRVPLDTETFEDEKFTPLWKKAEKDGNMRLLLYALSKEKNPYAKALTLAKMGAVSESLVELDKIKDPRTQMIVLSHHFASLNQKRVKGAAQVIIDDLEHQAHPPKLTDWQAFMVYYTLSKWPGLEVSANIRDQLKSKARGVDHSAARDWIRNEK